MHRLLNRQPAYLIMISGFGGDNVGCLLFVKAIAYSVVYVLLAYAIAWMILKVIGFPV